MSKATLWITDRKSTKLRKTNERSYLKAMDHSNNPSSRRGGRPVLRPAASAGGDRRRLKLADAVAVVIGPRNVLAGPLEQSSKLI